MPSIQYDLEYLRAGLEELESYLLSNELYWPVGAKPPAGEPAYPRLTLSGLLLARKRLHARSLPNNLPVDLARLDQRLDETRDRWRVAWEAKATREFHARLNLWRDFLQEYRDHPENNADRYAYEVQRRAMLDLLAPDATGAPQAERDLLHSLDQLLRAVLVSGEFVWETELQHGFPADEYWYLYGRLKK
jgi:hypothetical protein